MNGSLLKWTCCAVGFFPAWSPTRGDAGFDQRLNVLVIVADDLGGRDLGIEGSRFYETPHLDRLGRTSARFTQAYAASPVCSPSRASILTGQSTPRHGITDWIGARTGDDINKRGPLLTPDYARFLEPETITVAKAFKASGYTTFFAGKWHLGAKTEHWPESYGFDINIGGYRSGRPRGGYFPPYRNPRLPDGEPGEYLPLRLGRETVAFMEAHRDQPFFAMLCFYAVHTPVETTRVLWSKYRDKAKEMPEQNERFAMDRSRPVRQVQDHPGYAGLLETMDESVGMVLAALEKFGLAENTVVLFTSDNGGMSAGESYCTSNLPFRGGKGQFWEGGVRVPLFIRVPGLTDPGQDIETPAIGMDIYPTLLELAGLPMPEEHAVDGVSLAPALRGETLSDRDLFWHYPHYRHTEGTVPTSSIRSGNWKLIHYWEDGRDEMYDLSTDPGEQHNVAEQNPLIRSALRGRLNRWLQEIQAATPQPDPEWSPRDRRFGVRKESLEETHRRYLEDDWMPDPTWWGSEREKNEPCSRHAADAPL